MSNEAKSSGLRFGEFTADLATGEIFKAGVKVPLQEKPFQIFLFLLQHPQQLVSRQEIIAHVWPDTFVEGDICLNVAIRRLRSALQDDASHPRFIETVGSHGYRFIAHVYGQRFAGADATGRDPPRLAIFPMKAVGSQASDFCATMNEVLVSYLRRLHPSFVLVTPEFTTERAHKGGATLSLCHRVGADYALVGLVSHADRKVCVTSRLLSCKAQACIWAESYMREGEDWLAIQEEIASKIAYALHDQFPRDSHSHTDRMR
jgi:DNA-binding winged helix-turn-helix (wHTH) protein